MKGTKLKGPALSRSPRPRRDRRVPSARWAWTALSLFLAANWGTDALMTRGYSAEDCRKILGGNLLRVFREVEQVARELQAENRPRITEKQPFDKVQK